MNLLRSIVAGWLARMAAEPDPASARRVKTHIPRAPARPPGAPPALGDDGIAWGDDRDASDLLPPTLQEIYKALEGGADDATILDLFQMLPAVDQLNALTEAFKGMPSDQIPAAMEFLNAELNRAVTPLPGPQTMAYYSEAAVLGYGGAAGSGKSFLMCGLAGQEHTRSLILRREAVQLTALIDEFQNVYRGRGTMRMQPVRRFDFDDPPGRTAIFGHCQLPDDWRAYAGQARDLLALDEATEFLRPQVFGLMAWVRTADQNQRTRVVMATNPPRGAEGYWFVDMFKPWLDENHPNRAAPGELRYAIVAGGDMEYIDDPEFGDDGKPKPVERGGEPYTPRSFTFIPGRVHDNPYLIRSGYVENLQSLPEPLRSQLLYGKFSLVYEDADYQVIPSAWVDAAMKRWAPNGGDGREQTAIGVDIAQGGRDRTTVAVRHGNWFAPLQVTAGEKTPDGASVAARIFLAMKNPCPVVVDLGGGWGGATWEKLRDLQMEVIGFKPGETTSLLTREGLKLRNNRAYVWWRMREALDPVNGDMIALPPDDDLRTELTMPTFKESGGVLVIESKADIFTRLKRSTDVADAVVQTNYAFTQDTRRQPRKIRNLPQTANLGYSAFKRSMGRRR